MPVLYCKQCARLTWCFGATCSYQIEVLNEKQESTNRAERVVVIGKHEDPGTCYAQLVGFVYHMLAPQNTVLAKAKVLLILIRNQTKKAILLC